MLLLDVNVVVAIHRGDHPHHEVAMAWFAKQLDGQQTFTVPDGVWVSFLRITTNRRIFPVPTSLDQAFEFMDAVSAQAGYVGTRPGDRHMALLAQVSRQAEAVGDLIADAALAAHALEIGATVATFDRDFGRFEAVSHVRPK